MFRIRVKGFGREDMLRLEVNMRKATNRGLEALASKLAEIIRNNILSYSLVWRGTLLDSVKVERVKRSALFVSMVFYSKMLETGHRIPPGVKIPTLIAWARSKLPNPEAWLKKVFVNGWYVDKRPFISDSLETIKNQIKPILKLYMRQVK